ncbi:MAG: Ppx/GppA phosphatase family protein [Alphaproteobacteria bacterium]
MQEKKEFMTYPYLNNHCHAHNPIMAALDLGTNSCRLIISMANVANMKRTFFRRRPFHKFSWKVLYSSAQSVCLGEGLHESGVLSEEAIERTIKALSFFRDKIDDYDVTYIRAIATEACRRAKNSSVLIDRAREELGFNIEVISSQEEATLTLKGCIGVFDHKIPYGIVFDIGGGSTEAIWVHINEQSTKQYISFDILDSVSIPYGVVTLGESFPVSDISRYSEIKNNITSALKDFVTRNKIDEHVENSIVQFVGSSGTVTTLTAVYMGLERYERRVVDGVLVQIKDLRKTADQIFSSTHEERVTNPCIGESRAKFVLVGSLILEGIFDAIPSRFIRIADRGIREGLLSEIVKNLDKPDYKRFKDGF